MRSSTSAFLASLLMYSVRLSQLTSARFLPIPGFNPRSTNCAPPAPGPYANPLARGPSPSVPDVGSTEGGKSSAASEACNGGRSSRDGFKAKSTACKWGGGEEGVGTRLTSLGVNATTISAQIQWHANIHVDHHWLFGRIDERGQE